jgi:hypothetical protein
VPLTRTQPTSRSYGIDRGHPIDRVYIEDFLALHEADIRGDVLEVQNSLYAGRYGGTKVATVTVLDVKSTNKHATLIADICQPGSLGSAQFDCIILTQTLHFLPDLTTALQNLWIALAPNGTLLVTAPALSRVDIDDVDYWRWTPVGLDRLLRAELPSTAEVRVEAFGNALAGAAFFLGLASENIGLERVRRSDPFFPVVSCARVVRHGRAGTGTSR